MDWDTFASEHEGGRNADVMVDATLALPLLVLGVLERMETWR